MSKLPHRLHRPASERGFTLIELLVVIIILGILAAVVVFAVSGVGDKGKSSAVAIDDRTIRTAEEAYCAKFGEYASGAQLVQGGFLSEVPKYHQVDARANTGGPCNGWTYYNLRTAQADAYPPGQWDLVAPPGLGSTRFMVRLADGRVLAGGADPTLSNPLTQIWNPSDNSWTSPVPIPQEAYQWLPSGGYHGNTAVLLSDDPSTSQSECKSATVDNCGKVFHQGVSLFNPNALPGQQWETLPMHPGCNVCTRSADGKFTYLQVKPEKGPCGVNCGKIFIWASNTSTHTNMDIYDPRDNSYTVLPFSTDPALNLISRRGAARDWANQISDGRIFICCSNVSVRQSVFLDPVTLLYSAGPIPGDRWERREDPPAAPVLPNGDVFFTQDLNGPLPFTSGIYRPAAGAPGTFDPPFNCAGADSLKKCRAIGSLSDGRVLLIRTSDQSRADETPTYLYNPATGKQDPAGDLNSADSYEYSAVFLDPSGGPCGAYCGKWLVSGRLSAEVYTP